MIAAFLALFAAFGFWSWGVFVLTVIALFFFVEFDRPIGGLFALGVGVGLLKLFGAIDGLFGAIFAHPGYAALGLGVYLIGGVIWAVIKWTLFVIGRRERYNEARSKFLFGHGKDPNGPMPDELKAEWAKDYRCRENNKPNVMNHKSTIMTWMGYWPWSAVWTIINDPIRRSFRFAYARIKTSLQRVADRVYANIADDLPPPSTNATE